MGCTGIPENVKPVNNFILEKYLGRWYETARLDHSFERGLRNPELYTSGMDAKTTCEKIMEVLFAKFKSRQLLARGLEHHLIEDPRVLWALKVLHLRAAICHLKRKKPIWSKADWMSGKKRLWPG
jgi:hypothetical protein